MIAELQFDFSVLRDLRRQAEMTLAQVSERSGVSSPVISRLERNRTSPDLDTLFRLSRVFQINSADLLRLAESRTAHRKNAESYASNGFDFEVIRYGNAACFHGTAKAGARTSRPEVHQDDYEICWVRSGTVEIELPDERYVLTAGEAVQFDAVLHHSYIVHEDCDIMITHIHKGKRF